MAVYNNVVTMGKAQAIGGLVTLLTSEKPLIVDHGTYLAIEFTDNQKTLITDYIEKTLSAEPSDIRINWGELTIPALFRVYGRYLIMAIVISFLLGKISG